MLTGSITEYWVIIKEGFSSFELLVCKHPTRRTFTSRLTSGFNKKTLRTATGGFYHAGYLGVKLFVLRWLTFRGRSIPDKLPNVLIGSLKILATQIHHVSAAVSFKAEAILHLSAGIDIPHDVFC